MVNSLTEIIGTIAAIGSAAIFFPQVLKVVKTRHTKNISLIMYIVAA